MRRDREVVGGHNHGFHDRMYAHEYRDCDDDDSEDEDEEDDEDDADDEGDENIEESDEDGDAERNLTRRKKTSGGLLQLR
ncbi:hypothetical protein LTR08_000955 [Meristemomyces frigidus]|nr:hypothetical protein LTR08_000955 [Meristemomyces frigidus]